MEQDEDIVVGRGNSDGQVKWRAVGGSVVVLTAAGSAIELSATKAVGLRSGRKAVEEMRDELTAWLDHQRPSG